MKFYSTRDEMRREYSPTEVIKLGLAPDGGLFVPESIPTLTLHEIEGLGALTYPELSASILSRFFTDFTYDEILSDCQAAYSQESFVPEVCPLVRVNNDTYLLELWHGPSSAFKDVALQLMPRLFSRAMRHSGESRRALVLVATSGDTGKAALEGYSDVDGTDIAVFYPDGGVSEIQRLQMVTQRGSNVCVCGVRGNFDDIQSAVKRVFSDPEINSTLSQLGYFLTSANSINFARFAPQIPYYFKAYCELLHRGDIELGERIAICVPTGNFGNILAAYVAGLMGLPIERLICASNANSVLTEFLSCGRYNRGRDFYTTVSPSMDILISSNLERLLYYVCGVSHTAKYMSDLQNNGEYTLTDGEMSEIRRMISGYCADDAVTLETVARYYREYGYLADTHTAVALSALDQHRASDGSETGIKTVVASTASPYKFAASVYSALFPTSVIPHGGVEVLTALSDATDTEIPIPLRGLDKREVRFTECILPSEIGARAIEYATQKGAKK